MANFKNSIQLGVKVDPKQDAEKQLQNIINNINKNKISLDVEFKGDAYKNLQNLNTIIDSLHSKTGQGITLDGLTKSIESSLSDISKLNSEISKISRTDLGEGLFKQVENLNNGLGQTKRVTSVVQQIGDEFQKVGSKVETTTQDVEKYNNSLLKIEQAQNSLSRLTMVDNDKIVGLQNVFNNKDLISSINELNTYLNQVKELEEEEKNLLNLKQKETELNTKLNNIDCANSQKQAYSELSNLQREEYSLKERLITAEGEYKQKLEERLVEVNLLKNAQKQDIKNNNLTSIQKENDLIKQQEQLQEQLNQSKAKSNDGVATNIQKETEAYEKEQQAIKELIEKEINLLNIKKNSALAKDEFADTSAIDKAISKYEKLDSISMKDLRTQISYIKAELSEASTSADTFGSKLSGLLSKIGIYVNAGDIFRGIVNGAKNAINYVIDVENSMIDLRRVVDMSDSQALTFQNSMHDLSVQLASTNANTISTVATFSKLGYSIEEATNLGNVVSKYNLAADINDINSATLSLISTLKGYNLDAKDAEEVTNEINEVSNKYAVTATDMNEILKRSSSTMSTFGNSLKENLSLGAVANEITQDASRVGNALKSIGARITTNSNALDELEAMGISIEDVNGNLKSTYQIFKEMSPLIQNMKGQELARVSNNLFGKNQISVGLAIVQNYKHLDEVMGTLGNTADSVNKEFDRYLDSTQAKLTQLKENMGGLYSQFVNSDMTKTTVDGLNSIVTGVTGVISKLGALPSILGVVTTALTIFNKKFRESMTNYQPTFVSNLKTSFTGLRDELSDYTKTITNNINEQKKSIKNLNEQGNSAIKAKGKLALYQTQLGAVTVAEKACAIGAEALGVAFNVALGIGIGLAIEGIAKFIGRAETLKTKNEELISSMQTLGSDVTSIEGLKTKYSELSEAIKNGGLSAQETTEKKQELKEVYDELIQKVPELKDSINLESGAYEDQVDAIQKVIDKKNEDIGLKAEQYIKENKVTDSSVEKQISEVQRLQSEMAIVEKNLNRTDLTDSQKKNTQDYITNLRTDLSELKNSLGEVSQVQDTLNKLNIDNGISDEELQKAKEAVNSIDLYSNSLDKNTDKTDKNTNSSENNAEARALLSQASRELTNNGEVTTETVLALSQAFPDLGINIENATEKLDELGVTAQNSKTHLSELKNEFESFSSSNSDIDSVIEDMQDYGGITEETYGKIIDNPDILQALTAEGDTIQNLTNLQKKNKQSMEDRIQQAVNTANGVNSSQKSEADSKEDTDNQKLQSDSNANNQIRQNSADTTNQNGENYDIDSSNFDSSNQSKNNSDVNFENWWRENTSDSVNSLGEMYKIDVQNFVNAMHSKEQMLSAFKQKLSSMSNALNAETGGLKLTDKLSQPWNTDLREATDNLLGTDTAGAFESELGSKLAGVNQIISDANSEVKKLGSSFLKMANGIDDTPINFKIPEMVKATNSGSGSKGKSGSGGSGSSGKSDAEKQAEKEQKEAVERDKKAIEAITKAYEDAENQISNAIDGIDYSLDELGDNATLNDKIGIDQDKLRFQNNLLNEASKQLSNLTNASMETEDGQDSLSDAIQKATETLHAQKKAVQELNSEMKDYALDAIKEMLEKQQELEQLALEATQQAQKNQLSKSSYNFSESEFNNYKKSIKKGLKDDISDLEDMLEDETDLANIQVIKDGILDKQLQLNDLEKQSYDNISDLADVYEKLHTERSNAIQSQIDDLDEELEALEEENEAEERSNTLLEKKNTLKQAELDLERLKNQKTVYSYEKQEDGTYQFEWTVDQSAIDEAQQAVDDAKNDYNDTKDSYELEDEKAEIEARKKTLQKQLELEENLVSTKNDLYNKDLANLESAQEKATNALENKYKDMDTLSKEWLENFQNTYGTGWNTIATAITTSTDSISQSLEKLTDIKATEGIEGLVDIVDQSGLLDIKLEDVQEKVKINSDGLNEILTNTLNNNQSIKDSNNNLATDLLTIQNTSQNNQLSSYKDFASVYSIFSDKFLGLVQAITDFRFSNMTNIAETSLSYIMQALVQAEEAYNEFVDMMNEMNINNEVTNSYK